VAGDLLNKEQRAFLLYFFFLIHVPNIISKFVQQIQDYTYIQYKK